MKLKKLLSIHNVNTYVSINKTKEPKKIKEVYKDSSYPIIEDREIETVSLHTFYDHNDLINVYMYIKIRQEITMQYKDLLCKDIECRKCPFYDYDCPNSQKKTLLEILKVLKINSYAKARLYDELCKEYNEDEEEEI